MIDRDPSPPVPQVSTIASAVNATGVIRARIARAAPTTSSTVSPFMRSAVSSAPICAGVALPSMISPMTDGHLVRRQIAPVHHARERLADPQQDV